MNKTTAMLTLLGVDMPSPTDLKDIVYHAYIAHLQGSDEAHGDQDTMEALIRAYVAIEDAFRHNEDRGPLDTITSEEAERLFIEEMRRGYREWVPSEPDDSESFPWWPEYLPYKSWLYSKEMIKNFGYLAGYHEGKNAKALYAFFQEMKEGEAEKDSKF